MGVVQFHSRVGDDGVLTLQVPLGSDEANAEVLVTIQPVGRTERSNHGQPWHDFVQQTYGSCARLGLEEPVDRGETAARALGV